MRHLERHRSNRVGWLRAAVLGANDGIVSTASLLLGVAAAHATRSDLLTAGVAGLVALTHIHSPRSKSSAQALAAEAGSG